LFVSFYRANQEFRRHAETAHEFVIDAALAVLDVSICCRQFCLSGLFRIDCPVAFSRKFPVSSRLIEEFPWFASHRELFCESGKFAKVSVAIPDQQFDQAGGIDVWVIAVETDDDL